MGYPHCVRPRLHRCWWLCRNVAAELRWSQPPVPSADTLTSRGVAQVSSLTSPLSRSKMGPFVRSFLRVIVRSAS